MTKFSNKLVAILNKSVEPGRLMNALAHMSFGLGSTLNPELAQLCQYEDTDGSSHPNISAIPFIILRANSNKIRKLRIDAINYNINYVDFIDTMTEGTYQEQLDRTRATKDEDFNYFGIVLFGDWEKVSELTKKFSLWR